MAFGASYLVIGRRILVKTFDLSVKSAELSAVLTPRLDWSEWISENLVPICWKNLVMIGRQTNDGAYGKFSPTPEIHEL